MDSSAQVVSSQNRLGRRSAVRTAVMDSARRIAARDGAEELSLTAVAAEAGFGQSTVFGHFRNKDELVLAILAEDLAAMAALMRETRAPRAQSEPTEHEITPNQPTVLFEETPEISSAVVDIPQVLTQSEDTSASAWPEKRMFSLASSDDVEHDRSAHRMPDFREDSTAPRPRVDAWLERRLRVFEHSLADLEQRLKETESSAERAAALSEQAMTSLSGRVESFERQQKEFSQSLLQRLEQTEQRQRGATAEMRAAMNDSATRIEILEAARRADQSRSLAHSQAESDGTEHAKATEHSRATDEAYVQAAQRAATAAAVLVDMDRKPVMAKHSVWKSLAGARVRVSRRQYFAVACAALLAFVLGAFVAFYIGQAHGRETASLATRQQTPVRAVHKIAAAERPPVKDVLQHRPAPPPPDRLAALAQAGNAKAELLVGLRYLRGDGAAPDQPQAAYWIRRAAEQHDPLAQYWMGSLYEQGDGVAADSAEAVRWYDAAAGQGNRKAMHALGVAYAQGQGTEKDYSEAARWFAKAAALGLVNSQFNLAVLYERGLGVPQSLRDAYRWYAIAAAQGDQESRVRVEALKTQLNADDLAAAERAAHEFRPQVADRDANEIPVLADAAAGKPARP